MNVCTLTKEQVINVHCGYFPIKIHKKRGRSHINEKIEIVEEERLPRSRQSKHLRMIDDKGASIQNGSLRICCNRNVFIKAPLITIKTKSHSKLILNPTYYSKYV